MIHGLCKPLNTLSICKDLTNQGNITWKMTDAGQNGIVASRNGNVSNSWNRHVISQAFQWETK